LVSISLIGALLGSVVSCHLDNATRAREVRQETRERRAEAMDRSVKRFARGPRSQPELGGGLAVAFAEHRDPQH
jgi:hypothetical protein